MTTVYLGNPKATRYKPNPDGDPPEKAGTLKEAAVTTINVSPDSTRVQACDEILRCWHIHSSAVKPSWVECDDAVLQALLSDTWGDLPAAPKSVEKSHHTPDGPPGSGKRVSWPLLTLTAMLFLLAQWMLALRTNAGRDHQSRVSFATASTGTGIYAAANYIAVTEDATAPAAGDTTLTTELAVEGFARAQATYAHTDGTAVVTLTKTFTMSGGTSRTIRNAGLFNAATVGTMAYKTAVPSPPTMVSGDAMSATWSFTL